MAKNDDADVKIVIGSKVDEESFKHSKLKVRKLSDELKQEFVRSRENLKIDADKSVSQIMLDPVLEKQRSNLMTWLDQMTVSANRVVKEWGSKFPAAKGIATVIASKAGTFASQLEVGLDDERTITKNVGELRKSTAMLFSKIQNKDVKNIVENMGRVYETVSPTDLQFIRKVFGGYPIAKQIIKAYGSVERKVLENIELTSKIEESELPSAQRFAGTGKFQTIVKNLGRTSRRIFALKEDIVPALYSATTEGSTGDLDKIFTDLHSELKSLLKLRNALKRYVSTKKSSKQMSVDAEVESILVQADIDEKVRKPKKSTTASVTEQGRQGFNYMAEREEAIQRLKDQRLEITKRAGRIDEKMVNDIYSDVKKRGDVLSSIKTVTDDNSKVNQDFTKYINIATNKAVLGGAEYETAMRDANIEISKMTSRTTAIISDIDTIRTARTAEVTRRRAETPVLGEIDVIQNALSKWVKQKAVHGDLSTVLTKYDKYAPALGITPENREGAKNMFTSMLGDKEKMLRMERTELTLREEVRQRELSVRNIIKEEIILRERIAQLDKSDPARNVLSARLGQLEKSRGVEPSKVSTEEQTRQDWTDHVQRIANANTQLKVYREIQTDLDAKKRAGTITKDDYASQSKSLKLMIGNTEQLAGGFLKARTPMRALGDGLKGLLTTMKQLAEWQAVWYLTKSLIFSIPQIITLGVEFAKTIDDWNFKMIRWGATSGKVTDKMRSDVKGIVTEMRESALVSGATFEQIGKAAEGFVGAGVPLETVKKMVPMLSTVTAAFPEIDMEKFGIATVGAFNVFKDEIKGATDDAGKFKIILEQLLRSQAESIVRPEQFTKVMQYMAEVGKVAGATTEEVFALSTGVADTGITAAQSARLLSTLIIQMSRPKVMSGFRELGIDVSKDVPILENLGRIMEGVRSKMDFSGKIPTEFMTHLQKLIPVQQIKVIMALFDRWDVIQKSIVSIRGSKGAIEALDVEKTKSIVAQLAMLGATLRELGMSGNVTGNIFGELVTVALDAARGALLGLNSEIAKNKFSVDKLGATGQGVYHIVKSVSDSAKLLWGIFEPFGKALLAFISILSKVPGLLQAISFAGIIFGISKLITHFKLLTIVTDTYDKKLKSTMFTVGGRGINIGQAAGGVLGLGLLSELIPSESTTVAGQPLDSEGFKDVGKLLEAGAIGTIIAVQLAPTIKKLVTKIIEKLVTSGSFEKIAINGAMGSDVLSGAPIGTLAKIGAGASGLMGTSTAFAFLAPAIAVGVTALGAMKIALNLVDNEASETNTAIEGLIKSLKDLNETALNIKMSGLREIVEAMSNWGPEGEYMGLRVSQLNDVLRAKAVSLGIPLTANVTQVKDILFKTNVVASQKAEETSTPKPKKPGFDWPTDFIRGESLRQRRLENDLLNIRLAMLRENFTTMKDMYSNFYSWGLISVSGFYDKEQKLIKSETDASIKTENDSYKIRVDLMKKESDERLKQVEEQNKDKKDADSIKGAKAAAAETLALEETKLRLEHEHNLQKIYNSAIKQEISTYNKFANDSYKIREESYKRESMLIEHQTAMRQIAINRDMDVRSAMNEFLYQTLQISAEKYYNDERERILEKERQDNETAKNALDAFNRENKEKLAVLDKTNDTYEEFASVIEKVNKLQTEQDGKNLLEEIRVILKKMKDEGRAPLMSEEQLSNLITVKLQANQTYEKAVLTNASTRVTGMTNLEIKGMSDINKIWTHGASINGKVYKGFTGVVEKANDDMVGKFMNVGQHIYDIWNSVSTNMSDSFKTVFSDMVKGELQSVADYFNKFCQSILDSFFKMISDMASAAIASGMKDLLFKLIGGGSGLTTGGGTEAISTTSGWGAGVSFLPEGFFSKHSGGYIYHEGGYVPRFHWGGLSSDEVPAILQKGEYVVSRQGVSALDRINRGDVSSSGGTGTVNVVINNKTGVQTTAKQTSSHFDAKKQVKTIFLDLMRTDPGFRGQMRG